MSSRSIAFCLLLTGSVCAGTVSAQDPDICATRDTRSEDAFVECARAATSRFADRSVAVLEGFRPIGGDFPGMGEHWIHVGRVFDGEFDPARPEVLSYIVVEGRPVLLGVAYTVPLLGAEVPPDWPVGREAWHDHYRSLEEETFVPEHLMSGTAGDEPRLAMLHAWIWSHNPEGTFAADNWSIPYLRLGLDPGAASPLAGRALSLESGGVEYFARGGSNEEASTEEASRVTALLEAARGEVATILGAIEGTRLSPEASLRLAEIWTGLGLSPAGPPHH